MQPIDDGAGRLYKQLIGQFEDEWLEDDDNLRKWENFELTASDRRILLAQWYVKAHNRIVDEMSSTIRKWFEHTGALLTADGSGDDLIKLEGMPKGHKFSWVDDEVPQEFAALQQEIVDDPPDQCPERESTDGAGNDERDVLDDDDMDDEDEDDFPPEPRKAPAGFKIVEAPNFPHEALTPKTAEQQQLVGRSLLYYWAAVGWCVGVVTEANTDGRRKIKIEDKMVVCNFFVHYEIDDKTAQHCLLLEKYGGEDTDSWVLLEPIEEA